VLRVRRSGREQIGQTGCIRLCSPTGRIRSRNANMLHLKRFHRIARQAVVFSNARLKFKRMFETEARNFRDISLL
jgi:hypothetical protein